MSRKKENTEFTNAQMAEIYSIVNEFGGENKINLRRRIEALLRQDRSIIHYKLTGVVKQLYLFNDENK